MIGTLVAPLAAGFAAAPSGTAEFFARGTFTPIAAYADPECTVPLSSPVQLGADGGVEAYVAEAATVLVRTAAGVELRRFTVVTSDATIDVASASFTGTLASGSTSPGGTVDLNTALGRIRESFGAADAYVRRSGAAADETLVDALSAVASTNQYADFNITTYGAVAGGVIDTTTAWKKANDAAVAAGGGTIYVPRGVWFFSQGVSITAPNVRVRGDGPNLSRMVFNPASGSVCLTVNAATTSFSGNAIEDVSIESAAAADVNAIQTTASPGTLIRRVKTLNCGRPVLIGTRGIVMGCEFNGVNGGSTAPNAVVYIEGGTEGSAVLIGNHIVLSSLQTAGVYWYARHMVAIGNTVDASACAAAADGFFNDQNLLAPFGSHGSVIMGNRIRIPAGFSSTSWGVRINVDIAVKLRDNTIYTTGGPTTTQDFKQGGANYSNAIVRGDREGKWGTQAPGGATIAPNVDFSSELHVVAAGGPWTVSAPTGSGSPGQRYTLGIRNINGAGQTINPFGGGAGNFHGTVGGALANNTNRYWLFEYQLVAGVGAWYQIGASIDVT